MTNIKIVRRIAKRADEQEVYDIYFDVGLFIKKWEIAKSSLTREEAIAWLEKQGEQKPTKQLNADEVIEWLNNNVADFWESPCSPEKIIKQFKKDFGL